MFLFLCWYLIRYTIIRRPKCITVPNLYIIFMNRYIESALVIFFSEPNMQRLISLVKTVSALRPFIPTTINTNAIQSVTSFLSPWTPMTSAVCNFKIKGRLRRRCKSCYFVFRDERMYVICPKSPRHKQMAMKPKPHNTWILTHASQSPVRPWWLGQRNINLILF